MPTKLPTKNTVQYPMIKGGNSSHTFRISVTRSDMNTNIVGTYYATYIHIRGTLIGAEDNSAYMTN